MTPMRAAADRAVARPPRRGRAAVLAVLALAAVGYASVRSILPPPARGAATPAGQFSAVRAFTHVEAVAVAPHVAGSVTQGQAREYLLDVLRSLGLSPELQDAVSVQGGALSSSAGGREIPTDRTVGGGWGFGFVFHAPPASGVEVTLTVRGTGPVDVRVMDGSDGLSTLQGFQVRPPDVGVLGSHISDLCA